MIYPLPAMDGVEGNVGEPVEPFEISSEQWVELLAIHPTSDVGRLLEMPIDRLRNTVVIARDIYNQGLSSHPGDRVDFSNRVDMAREVLRLRAKFCAMPWRERECLKVGRTNDFTAVPPAE
jgi:hypothetical protein